MKARREFGFTWFAVVAVVLLGSATVRAQDQTQMSPAQDQGQASQGQEQDPPDRIARVSFLQGDVSLQPGSPNGDAAFAAAEINYTLSAGDRLYTGQGGMGELESDNLALRLGPLSDVTMQSFSEAYVQLGLAQGNLRVRSYSLGQPGSLEIDTANGAFTVLQAGDVRVSSYPGFGQRPDTTIVTVNAGRVQASANGVNTVIESGQVLRIDSTGQDQAQAQFVQMLPMDALDQFDQQRDEQRAGAAGEIRDEYVNPSMVGYDDLQTYGDWGPSPDYGQVWYPRAVDAGWSPYHNGHWAYIAPWGYTWVEAEPWGFAPFHYGRWAQFGGRWGWVPGPSVVRPVYSPALVAFVGGGGFSLAVRVGGGGGVAAWFPLGPREPFVPWYRASPGYVNRVNVSNIYNRNVVEVRTVYGNRTSNVYGNIPVNVYVNRDRGMVAVPQQAFAQGRQVRAAQVRVDPKQMQQAQVMTRPPEVSGRPQPTQGLAPARAVPQQQARPQFQGQGRFQGGQGRPAAAPTQSRPAGQVMQTPTPARIPGGMRPQNPGNNNPDLPANQTGRPQRPTDPGTARPAAPVASPQQQQPQRLVPQQPGRTPEGRDLNESVGGGRNVRPADPGVSRPVTPQPRPVTPVPTPAPAREQVKPQQPPVAPQPQVRPPAPQPRQTPPPQRQQAPPRPVEHKEEPK